MWLPRRGICREAQPYGALSERADICGEFPAFDLSVLSELQREVITMRYCADLSWSEIARLLDSSRQLVRYHHDRALFALSQQYGEG